jgi:HPt (histidine-containing phosphotransfer) domain-containing protein
MAAIGIENLIEALSEAVVFLDPGELNALADLHTQLEDVEDWATHAGMPRTVSATRAVRGLIEKVILEEAGDPARALSVISETVSGLQRIVRDGVPDAEVEFPSALGVSRPERSTPVRRPPQARGPELEFPTAKPFKVELPPYVDEAIFAEFLARQDTVLEEIETALLDLEHGANAEAQGILARHLHTLKGETALLGLSDIEQLCHTAEDLLDRESPAEVADRLLSLKDWLKQAFDAYAGKGGAPPSLTEMLEILMGTREPGGLSPALEAPLPATAVPAAMRGELPVSGYAQDSATGSPGIDG